MCMPKMPKTKSPIVASRYNEEAQQRADMEARLRKRRAGAAANILTGPGGIPAGTKLGQPA